LNIIEKAIQSRAARGQEGPNRTAPDRPAPPRADGRQLRQVSFEGTGVRDLLAGDGPDPLIRAEFRHLKRALLQSAFGPLAEPGSNIVAITSPMPGAGKTFLSLNLAESLSMERDRTALLIDADETRASLSRALGVHGQPGLFDTLYEQRADLGGCTYATDRPGLEFVPAGGQYPDSLELLTSNRTRDLFSRLAQADRNRLILLDCPPILGTPNGGALAALAGQVLLVVEAGANTEVMVEKSLELLNRDKPIGLVLNKLPRSGLLAAGTGGSYYYYYGPKDE
jgi:protein-tyrosine kinase